MPARLTDRCSRRSQRGATLFEGLIAMLLMGIVGVGITYILSRSALSQTTVNAQNIVINQIRAQLQNNNSGLNALCSAATPPPISLNASATVAVVTGKTCTMVQGTVSVNGGTAKTVFVPQLTITASTPGSASVLGGILTITNGTQ